ncbi:nuclear transport factor 2 family protein [Nocardioides sp. SOB77]|uniref:Nuclear transport factor 2 family protein n=1 Tax=Nocardioides oceani TaxID=3058369 RepID=A0ABT8FLZ2_9ACTN|nr:nuclear transport factor 2 family protein [Nocardioides oceani]MDN4175526.1 nuclear transport factor 2 family protein [Nocardioides oceani]
MDSARAIENLLYRYAELIDAGDLDGVAALFEHGSVMGQHGPAAVRELYAATTRIHEPAGTPLTHHVVTNPIVEVDESAGTAGCRSRFTVLQATDALPLQPVAAGRYVDTFTRVDGRWWFASRTMHLDLTGDLSQHLLL